MTSRRPKKASASRDHSDENGSRGSSGAGSLNASLLAHVGRTVCQALLGIIIAWAMLQPLDSTSVFEGSALPQNMAWILLAILVSLDQLASQRRFALSKVEVSVLLAVAVWMIVVTLRAGSSFNPRTGWHGCWHMLSAIALYYAIRSLILSAKERSVAIGLVLAGALTLSGVGVYQVTSAFPEMRAEYQRDPDATIAKMQLEAPAGSPARKRLEDRLNSPEPYATFSLANSLAALLSGALVISIGSLGFAALQSAVPNFASLSKANARTNSPASNSQLHRFQRGRWSVIALTAVCLLLGIVWFLTRSRVAYLAVPTAIGALILGTLWQYGKPGQFLSNSKAVRWIKLAAVCVFVIGVVGAGWMWKRDPLVFTEATKSLAFRMDYWKATTAMIADSPLFGVGLGNFQAIYPQYMLPKASETIADPHNWILDIASTCSLPIAIVIVVCLMLRLLHKPSSDCSQPIESGSSRSPMVIGAVFGGLLGWMGMYLFGYESGMLVALFVAMSVAGLLVWMSVQVINDFLTSSTVLAQSATLGILLCLLVSGSWQAGGLLVPILIGIAASRSYSRLETTEDSTQPEINPSDLAISFKLNAAALIAALLIMVGFAWQSWMPVLQSTAITGQSFSSRDQQLQAVEKARKQDPLNSELDRYRAKLLIDGALSSSTAIEFESACDAAVDATNTWTLREPNSFLTWQYAGDRLLELTAMSERLGSARRLQYLEQAAEFYAKAVQARPHSAQLRVQTAYCLSLLEKTTEAASELDRAISLSNDTPHAEQKIESVLIWTPNAPAELTSQIDSAPYSRAELVINWIRSHQKQ